MTPPLNVDRELFPITREQIYLNHAGVSPLPAPTAALVRAYADEAEKSGAGGFAAWAPRLKSSREEAARLLNADTSEIAFVKSTTQGLNNIAFGLRWNPGDVIVIEDNTFPANWYPWKATELFGAETWLWPERNYRYDLNELEERLKQGNVRLVAATTANFSTGYRHDLAALGGLCREYEALLCVDAIQTLGVFPTDVKELGIDFLSADSHKWLLGPEGAGIMYVAKDRLDLFNEHVVGWLGRKEFANYSYLDQPPDPTARRFEEGAPNIAGFTAMGESFRMINELGPENIARHNRQLCEVLENGLEELGWQIISPRDEHASSIVCAANANVDIDALVKKLNIDDHIIATNRRNFLRMAPHFYQTKGDMEKVVEAVEQKMEK